MLSTEVPEAEVKRLASFCGNLEPCENCNAAQDQHRIIDLLKRAGITPGLGDKEYERAKAVVFGRVGMMDSKDYARQLKIIVSYMGI